MLIISRKVNEGIVLDGDIKIVVVAVEGNKVKLGIKAPKHIGVLREELVELVKNENILAGETAVTEIDFSKFKAPKK
ncbi:MAG: hypothetical protein APF76_02320 [Desulfitibacter sp. BRH_c19]|nr:MAG: hypothetical protein APF76_02320 [Desulfitibacter sp. BRH_c19]